MARSALDWLTARPIAHRGLHDAARGVIENTAGGFRAAVAAGYGIELDLQASADGEAMVHHDDVLGRLTEGSAALRALTAQALKGVRFKGTPPWVTKACTSVSSASAWSRAIDFLIRIFGTSMFSPPPLLLPTARLG